MNTPSTISVARFDEFSWVRCEAKGNFMNSPAIKEWAEAQISSGESTLVVDLEACTGMDSTFMGNLAGLAMKLMRAGGGLQIADGGDKNIGLLEDLGLSSLMELRPEGQIWEKSKELIRERLISLETGAQVDKTAHVYETHKQLCEADESNNAKFSTVLDCLEAELSNKKKK